MPASNIFDTRLTKRTKHRPSNTRRKETFYVFDRMFDDLQVLSNTTKHIQTQSNSTKQGVQTVKCLDTKQCLMVFGRQTFIVCPGPYPWEVCVLCVTSIPTGKLPVGNHYGYIKKNKRITLDVSRTKLQGLVLGNLSTRVV